MSKPTVLIVGGAWHTQDYLVPLAKPFEDQGYSTKLVGLPSVGANPPTTDFTPDVKAVRDAATQLISEDKDIIAVLHSVGGIVGTEALQGLGKSQAGKAGVTALIYIAAHVPKAGDNFGDHAERIGNAGWAPARAAFAQNGVMGLPPDFAQHMFYSELPEDDQKHWAGKIQPQSVGIYDSKLSHETYRDIPSAYMLTANDNAFQYDHQQKTVEFAGIPSDRTVTVQTGHTPWLTIPGEVVSFALKNAGQA